MPTHSPVNKESCPLNAGHASLEDSQSQPKSVPICWLSLLPHEALIRVLDFLPPEVQV